MTASAERFVTAETLETLSGNRVVGGEGRIQDLGTQHIAWARWGQIFVLAPATANLIAKCAHGMADDELTTELLAFEGPKIVVPAMNPSMWSHPATQRNVKTLELDGWHLVSPEVGELACGEYGEGRMASLNRVVEQTASLFWARPPARPKRVLISLGPTRSEIDPVRYLTNRSSGKMGAALAWAAVEKGCDVTVVRGAVACAHDAPLPESVHVVDVQSTDAMRTEILRAFPESDIFVSAAAVLDWEAAHPAKEKIKKTDTALRAIEVKKTPDILAEVGQKKMKGQFILGFAAESIELSDPLDATKRAETLGRSKLTSKGCDAVFVNPVGSAADGLGFESLDNRGWWITHGDAMEIQVQSKVSLAHALLERVL